MEQTQQERMKGYLYAAMLAQTSSMHLSSNSPIMNTIHAFNRTVG